MKSYITFTGIFSLFFIGSLFLTGCIQGPSDVTGEITEANKKFIEAFNNQDAEALASRYTDDGSLFPPNSDVVTGHEAIASFWSGTMGMGIEKAELETVTAQAYGNFAIEEGRYRLFAPGDNLIDHGKYFVSWEKEGNEWKLDKDIWNSSNPAIPRAMENDTIWIVTTKVKPVNSDRLMEFVMNYYLPAIKEYFPAEKAKSRFFKDVEPDKDGDILYHYLVDPYSFKDTYFIKPVLIKKYEEAKVDSLLQEFSKIIVEQTQLKAVQLPW